MQRLPPAPAVDPAVQAVVDREMGIKPTQPSAAQAPAAPARATAAQPAPAASSAVGGALIISGQPTAVPTTGALAVVESAAASTALTVNVHAVEEARRAVAATMPKRSATAAEMAAFNRAHVQQSARLFKPDAAKADASNQAKRPREDTDEGEAPDAPAAPVEAAPLPEEVTSRSKADAAAAAATAEVETTRDYLGRSFMQSTLAPSRAACRAPTRMVGLLSGHKAGVQCLRWAPPLGHLLLSGDLRGCVMLWDAMGDNRRVGTYRGHGEHPVSSLAFTQSAERFSSAGGDGMVLEWDTETGAVVSARYCGEGKACASHAYHPHRARQHSLFGAVGKMVLQWDTRTQGAKPVREYDAHLAPILHMGFLPGGHHFMTTSEDKTVHTWDVDSAVAVQNFADPSMHAAPHFTSHPTDGSVVANTLDNRALVFAPGSQPGQFRLLKDRHFSGHVVSGSSCQVAFSKDGAFLSSGDVNGSLHVWDWASGGVVKSMRAHKKAVVAHLWHPVDPSRVVTSSWDGQIKMFV